MPKKKDQRPKPTPSTDSERETRVLLEEVRSDFKLLAEQYGSITSKLKDHDQEFTKLHGRLDKVEVGLGHVRDQLGQLQNQVSSVLTDHEHRLKALEVK